MAKIEDIIAQIQSQMPRYTDSFNDTNSIVSASPTGGVMSLELAEDNYQDSIVNINEIYAKLDVIGVSGAGVTDQYNLQTEIDHDQTYSDMEKQSITKYVTLVGDFAGVYTLKDVPANDIITIESSSVPPSGLNFSLIEDRGYDGRKNVTWIDAKNLTYDVDFDIEAYAPSGTVQSNIRIDAIASEANIKEYLENNAVQLTKNTMYVLMAPNRSSKNRETYSDAFNRKEYKDDLHTEVVGGFSVYMVLPSQTKITPRAALNEIFELRPYIVKSLHGAIFDSGFVSSNKFLCAYVGDEGEDYNKSYYIHRFDFELVFNIENQDSVPIDDTRAFRDFDIGLKLQFDEYEEVKKTIEGTIE